MTTPKLGSIMTKAEWQAEAFQQQTKVKAARELAEEFRRLAAEGYERADNAPRWDTEWARRQRSIGKTWEQAAQMVEERLNAD